MIHYHLPDESENYYTHRSGRTARAGRSGLSPALVNVRELDKIRQIEDQRANSICRIPDALETTANKATDQLHPQSSRGGSRDERGVEQFTEIAMHELADLKEGCTEAYHQYGVQPFHRLLPERSRLNVDLAHQGKQRQDRYNSNWPESVHQPGTVDGFDKGRMLGYVCDIHAG